MKKGTICLFIIIIITLTGCSNIQERFSQDDFNNIQTEIPVSKRTIGYIGCSNTRQTVYGYRWAEGNQIWNVNINNIHDYDSGSVAQWAKDAEKGKGFWEIFDRELLRNPETKKIWLQLCIPKGEAKVTYEQSYPIIEMIRKKIPNVTIYISPLAEYTENVCEITGVEGIERGISLAQELDSRNDDLVIGPILGPLSLAEINEEDKSKCHPNEEGMLKMGKQLRNFFDNIENSTINKTIIKS